MNQRSAIVSDKQLGDVLLLQPCAALLAHLRGIDTALFVNEAFHPLVELMPGCAFGLDRGESFAEVWTMSWGSQAAWQAFTLKTKSRLLVANKRRQIRWWYKPMFHEIRLLPITDDYWAHYFWQAVGGHTSAFVLPRLNPPPESWRHPDLPKGKFFLINPTAARAAKFWSPQQWMTLIHRLLKKSPQFPIVIAGGGSAVEKAHCDEIIDSLVDKVINLTGKTSLKQYLHLISFAKSMVCIDGAASHIAQAFEVPTVTIFGPTHEKKWHRQTPIHIALAARTFHASNQFCSASEVPVDAVWEALSKIHKMD